jgi:hypothetical protein
MKMERHSAELTISLLRTKDSSIVKLASHQTGGTYGFFRDQRREITGYWQAM